MKKFKAENCIAPLNNCKKALEINNCFTSSELKTCFKSSGLPVNSMFFATFLKSGLLAEAERNKYKWTDDKPIHIDNLKRIYERYHQTMNSFPSKQKTGNKVAPKVENKVATKTENAGLKIEEAIKLLKSKGYKIYKPEVTFKEV